MNVEERSFLHSSTAPPSAAASSADPQEEKGGEGDMEIGSPPSLQAQSAVEEGGESGEDLEEMTDADLLLHHPQALLDRKGGPWVYELYAVLIHSGSALGGHYYAYIRSLGDGKW